MEYPASDMVEIFARCASFLLTAEFFRRCVRMSQEIFICNSYHNNFALNGKSLPAILQTYFEKIITPWFDVKFVCVWLIFLAITLIRQENQFLLTMLPPFILFTSAYIFTHDRLLLNPSFIDNQLTDGTNHIGPGLAIAWFSFLENTLIDKDNKGFEALKQYKKEQSIGSGRAISEAFTNGYFITDRPIILFPDLAAYIEKYEKLLEAESGKWCMTFLNGIVMVDKMQREAKGEREWLNMMAEPVSYKYEVSGTTRDNECRVVRWEDNRPSNKITNKYFRVLDNRPLDSMRKWYHDQKGQSVTLKELKNQYDLFVKTLTTLLNKDERLKDKFYLLSFSGILSQELIAFENRIRNCEKKPPLPY